MKNSFLDELQLNYQCLVQAHMDLLVSGPHKWQMAE
jgi:hypothetical protein